jgi:hypothetical protein
MRLNKLLVPLAFSMLFSSGVSAAEEDDGDVLYQPTSCYSWAFNVLALNHGQALKLCSGTIDADATLNCFIRAHGKPKNYGGKLGLSENSSINLCKSNSVPF